MVEISRPTDVLGLPNLDVKKRLKTAGEKVKTKTTETKINIKQIVANDIAKLAEVRAQVSAHLKRQFDFQYEPQNPAERRAELQALSYVMKIVNSDYERQRALGEEDVPQKGDFRLKDLIRRSSDAAEASMQKGIPMEKISPYVKLSRKLEKEREESIKQRAKPDHGVVAEPQRIGKVSARIASPSLEKQASQL